MSNQARFWDRISAKYARKPIADEAAYREKLEVTRDYLQPDMEVLEFGCGTGGTAILLAPFVKRIYAIDFSPKMIEIARRRAVKAKVFNAKFHVASIEDFDAPAQGYDAVLGMSILHLVANRDAVIAKVHATLKPGGVFVSSTACMGDSMPWMRLVAPIGRAAGLLPQLRVFSGKQLKASLNRAGFEIEHESRGGKDKALFLVARKAG